MPRPSVEAERRQQILTAACEVISEVGMHKLRMTDVAARAGVSSGTVHYYFDSKRAVLAESLAFISRQSLERRREQLEANEPPLKLLANLMDTYVPEGEQSLIGWRVWLELWAEAIRDPHFQEVNETHYNDWRAMVAEVISRAQRDGTARPGDPTELADKLVSMGDGFAIQVLVRSRHVTPEKMHQSLRGFLDEYIALPGHTVPDP